MHTHTRTHTHTHAHTHTRDAPLFSHMYIHTMLTLSYFFSLTHSITHSYRFKLADFGAARNIDPEDEAPKSIVGTVEYLVRQPHIIQLIKSL